MEPASFIQGCRPGTKARFLAALDWLDSRPAPVFLLTLYLVRWLALAPVILWGNLVSGHDSSAEGLRQAVHATALLGSLVSFLLVSPALETLLECILPYLLIGRCFRKTWHLPPRPWGFVAASALFTALLHPVLPAILPSLITGSFLAYCYAHFASKSFGLAFLFTTGFHAAINLVGWTLLFLG